MPCLWLQELHPASQEHESVLNMDTWAPYMGVCSGFRVNTYVVSGRNSHLLILTWRAPQLCAGAPTPLSAVQQYTPSSLSSTLRMVSSCPFLWMLYRVSNSLQAQHRLSGTTRDRETELHLNRQAADVTTNGNKLYLWFSTHKQKGSCWKCWVQLLRFRF